MLKFLGRILKIQYLTIWLKTAYHYPASCQRMLYMYTGGVGGGDQQPDSLSVQTDHSLIERRDLGMSSSQRQESLSHKWTQDPWRCEDVGMWTLPQQILYFSIKILKQNQSTANRKNIIWSNGQENSCPAKVWKSQDKVELQICSTLVLKS